MYFTNDDGEYNFDPTSLPMHTSGVRIWLKNGWTEEVEESYVSNTSTQEWEMRPYIDMAEEKGYLVFSLIVENRHSGNNIHGVPSESIERMKNRFEIQL